MGAANTPVVQARVYKLPNRRDSSVLAAPECTLRAGEVVPIWIDPSGWIGEHWLTSADNAATDDADLVVESIDALGRLVILWLDLTATTAGDQITVEFQMHPTAAQTAMCGIVVNVI